MEGGAGIWAERPRVSRAEAERSVRIDEGLREDRVRRLKEEGSVVIVSGKGRRADATRRRIAREVGTVFGVDFAGLEDGDVGAEEDEVVVKGEIRKGTVVTVSSFVTDKRLKSCKLRLASGDPSVLVFLVNLSAERSGEESLTRSLSHFLFVCSATGDLKSTTVCVVLANCSGFKNEFNELDNQQDFLDALSKNFVQARGKKDVSSLILAISSEFQLAAQDFSPREVRCIFIDEDYSDCPSASVSRNGNSVAQQLVDIFGEIQDERIEEVLEADISGTFHNISRDSTKTGTFSSLLSSFVKDSFNFVKRIGSVLQNPNVKLAFFGIACAWGSFFVLKMLRSSE